MTHMAITMRGATMKCNQCGMVCKNEGGLAVHAKACLRMHLNKDSILKEYSEGKSLGALYKDYHLSATMLKNFLKVNGVFRNAAEARRFSIQKGLKITMSSETRDRIRRARLSWMRSHPEETSWRTRNKPSYPEMLFMGLCERNGLCMVYDIVRELCVFPYYVDFAFVNAMVAVEVDGSQHWKNQEVAERDRRKDELLVSKGWRVYRIPEFKLKRDIDGVYRDLLLFLFTSEVSNKKYGEDIVAYEELKSEMKRARRELKRGLNEESTEERHLLLERRRMDLGSLYPKPGWSVELGKLWGMSSQAASRFCKRNYGIGAKHEAVTKEKLEELFARGLSLRCAAKELGLERTTVSSYCKRYGISIPEPIFKVDWKKVYLKNRLKFSSIGQIAKELGVTYRSVWSRARKEGLI